MHDMNLGGPVDVGQYDGPMLDGKPLHGGNCEDGVYGCRMCNNAARFLTDEQLKAIGWATTVPCDWCKKETPVQEIRGVRPWDEGGSVYYEVCSTCYRKYSEELQREIEYDRQRYGNDWD